MSAAVFKAVDETLLLLTEARERAQRATHEARDAGAQPHLVEGLERLDRELLNLHRALMDDALMQAPAPERQLALEAA